MYKVKNVEKKYIKYIPLPNVFEDNYTYLGNIKNKYIPFMNIILKIFELLKRSVENDRIFIDNSIRDIKKRLIIRNDDFKDENCELFLSQIEHKNKSLKPMLMLILFLKTNDCDLHLVEDFRRKYKSRDNFIYYFEKLINTVRDNKKKVDTHLLAFFNDISFSEKDVSYGIPIFKGNSEKEKNNEESGTITKNDVEMYQKRRKTEDGYIGTKRAKKKGPEMITTETNLQNMLYPYWLLFMYKNQNEIENFSPNVLDLSTIECGFEYENVHQLVEHLGYDADQLELDFEGKTVELDKKRYYDMELMTSFNMEKFKNTKTPFKHDLIGKLTRSLLKYKDEKINNSIKNDLDGYIDDIIKVETIRNEINTETYGDIEIMMRNYLGEIYQKLVGGSYGSVTNKEYMNKYFTSINEFRKEALKSYNLVLGANIVEELKNYYSKSKKSLVYFLKERTSKNGTIKFFQYPTNLKDSFIYNEPYFLPYYILEFPIMYNYLINMFINMENVVFQAGNKEIFVLMKFSLNDQFTARYKLHWNAYIYGEAEAGKTFLVNLLKELSVGKTFDEKTTSGSDRSQEHNMNVNYETVIMNEAPMNILNEKRRQLDSTQQEIFKDTTTSCVYKREKMEKTKDGNWKHVEISKDLFICRIYNSNFVLPPGAINSRMVKITMSRPKEPGKIEKMMTASEIQKVTAPQYLEIFSKTQKDIQWLSAEYHKMCNIGLYPTPTLIMIKYFINYLFNDLKNKGVIFNNGVRYLEHFYITVTEYTIIKAIISTFCVPGSPGFRKDYTEDLMSNVAEKAYATLDIALAVLSMKYEIMFEDPLKINVNRILFAKIFSVKTAIMQYETKVMKLIKKKNENYVYKNKEYIEEEYEEEHYELNEKNQTLLNDDDLPIKNKKKKIFVHRPFINLSENHKKHEINYNYQLFALYEFFNNSDTNINFEIIKKNNDGVIEEYFDLNYVCITVKDRYTFYKMLVNQDTNLKFEDVKNYIETLGGQTIKPTNVLKRIKVKEFIDYKHVFEALLDQEDYGTKGLSRQEFDDLIRKNKHFHLGGFFKYINQDTQDIKKKTFGDGSGMIYDKEEGLKCCKIYEEKKKETNQKGEQVMETTYKICFLLSLYRFNFKEEFIKSIESFNYDGIKKRTLPLFIPSEGISRYPIINIIPQKDKKITISTNCHISDVNKKIINSTVNKDDVLEENIDLEEVVDDENIWKEEVDHREIYTDREVENGNQFTFTHKLKKHLQNENLVFGEDIFNQDIDFINFLLHQEQMGVDLKDLKPIDINGEKIYKNTEEWTLTNYMNYMVTKSKKEDYVETKIKKKLQEYSGFEYPNTFKKKEEAQKIRENVDNEEISMETNSFDYNSCFDDFESRRIETEEDEEINFSNYKKKKEVSEMKKNVEDLIKKKNSGKRKRKE